MAITFDELKAIAEQTNLKFLCDQEKQILLFGGLGKGGIYNLIVRLTEKGEAIYFRIPYLAVVPTDHPKLSEVMLWSMKENDRVKIGRFCYDPNDGEVYIDWFLPLEDGVITNQQFKRYLRALMFLADEVNVRLRHLIETGEDLPSEGKRVEDMLRRLLAQDALSEEEEVRLRRLLQDLSETENPQKPEGSEEDKP
jgi:hypothetical protein